eukprot:7221182-Pyramimonas_sp.AAC.1
MNNNKIEVFFLCWRFRGGASRARRVTFTLVIIHLCSGRELRTAPWGIAENNSRKMYFRVWIS